MATTNNAPKGKWDKIVDSYARHAYAVGIVYSVGAAVVIIGALFKILHWPGASYVLMFGMFTEALLFTIGIFEKPHATYHWENVFPQLIGEETKELLGGGMPGNTNNNQQTSANAPALSESDMKSLKEGIENLGKTANQLSELGKVAEGSVKLTEKMTIASQAVDQMAGVQNQLVASSEKLNNQYAQLSNAYQTVQTEVQAVAEMTKGQQKSIEGLNTQLSAVNTAYEMQLTALKNQAEAMKQQTETVKANTTRLEAVTGDLQKMQTAMTDAAKNATLYEDGAKKLASQIADLNKIYGNMLNALA
ncbi:MAG: gliding motility protein GldL [Paludibacteraceae bacterium]|nr:gliding motility protein GldL [Paludibacteraceae bacterium]